VGTRVREIYIFGSNKLLWAGDFNVNPYRRDWTEKALEESNTESPEAL
jgi:endonuclease/exonuclease/phosphatase family metal-dependent hydrolase